MRGGLAGLIFGLLVASPAWTQELSILDWSGYEDPNLHPAYTAKHGAEPAFTFFASEDEAFQKLRLGFKADLAHPCSNNVRIWREAGLLQPLDTSRIAGWNDILKGISDVPDLMVDAEGKAWFLPFDWGDTLVTYRTDKVKSDEIASLRAFADPKFSKRIALPDNSDSAYALGMLVAGVYDVRKVTDENFKAASDFLRAVHKNVRFYWNDPTEIAQAMASGEIDLAWTWNETATTLKAQGVPVETKKDTKEGLASWICGYVRLKDSPGDETKIYDFLNAISQPAVSNYMVTAWGYGHANGAGMATVAPEALARTGFADLGRYTDRTLFAGPMSGELKQRFAAEFEKIKAGY